MDALNETNTAKRTYEGSSGESVTSLSFAADTLSQSSLVDSVRAPSDSKPSSRSVKSSTGCRQRVTVVCAECKRLKLKCDRRVPCGSCSKRDTVQRCLYSPAAADKIDVQSLNNRLTVVEGKLELDPAAPGSANARLSSSVALTGSPLGISSAEKPRAFLAVGLHGSSVAVNLEGPAGLWVDHLGVNVPTAKRPSSSETAHGSGVELLPYPTNPEEGIIDFLLEYTELFRIPVPQDAGSDSEDDEDVLYHVGVSPDLVLCSFPSQLLRSEIYSHLEAAHIMIPCTNFFVFKQRIEDMCRWAELKSAGIEDKDEPHTIRPTLSFFAAAAIGLALGALCCLAERDMAWGSDISSVSTAQTNGTSAFSPADASPPVPGPGPKTVDRSMPPPPVPDSSSSPESYISIPLDATLPSMLYRLSKLALGLSLEDAGYGAFDIDYMHAKALQARYLLLSHHGLGDGANLLSSLNVARRRKVKKGKGKTRADGDGGLVDTLMGDATSPSLRKTRERRLERGPTLALAPEMVGLVTELVGNARVMGLNHDPEISGGERLSLYEKEMRRRLWWEIVSLDVFVADCLGLSPFIQDNTATTRFPSDVDEESFGPDSANLPAPNLESLQGNIEYFIQRCRFVDLAKSLRRKTSAFRELHRDAQPSETRDMLDGLKNDIAKWLKDLPDHLKLKDIPSVGSVPFQMDMKGMSPPKKTSSSPRDRSTPPQYDSPYLIAMRCDLAIAARYAFVMLCLPFARDTPAETNTDEFASSGKSFDTLFMMEPAMFIVRTWQYLHSIFRYVRPSMFICYAFTRQLFDVTVILAHMAIQQPLYAVSALGSVRVAGEVMRDPSVLTGRPLASDKGNLPSEAVRIVEELIVKAEAAFVGSPSMASMAKRKHEEVDISGSDFMYHFRFPFVGTGVVIAGSPASRSPGAGFASSPSADSGSVTNAKAAEPSQKGGRAKQSPIDKGVANGDPRPALTKQKALHPGLSIRARPQKGKETIKARANSAASTRSDAQLPPSSNSHDPGPPPPHQVAQPVQHHVPSEPPLLQASYRLSSGKPCLPVPGQHYMPSLNSTPSDEFSSGYGENGYPHAVPYGQPYDHQNVQITVSSQQPRGFDPYAPSNSSPHPTSTHAAHTAFNQTNGLDYPISMHQPSDYEAVRPGMAHLSTNASQDHRFAIRSNEADPPNIQNAPVQQPAQPHAFHPQPQAQPNEQMAALTPTQPGWTPNTVYQWNGYYQ